MGLRGPGRFGLGAVRDRVAALKAGLDWEMPGPQERRVKQVVAAVRAGELTRIFLTSRARILRIVFKAKETPKNGTFNVDAHHELAYQIATEVWCCSRNNGILPLKDPAHIAVIGRSAENAHFQGGGSSAHYPTKVAVPFKELVPRLGNAN